MWKELQEKENATFVAKIFGADRKLVSTESQHTRCIGKLYADFYPDCIDDNKCLFEHEDESDSKSSENEQIVDIALQEKNVKINHVSIMKWTTWRWRIQCADFNQIVTDQNVFSSMASSELLYKLLHSKIKK